MAIFAFHLYETRHYISANPSVDLNGSLIASINLYLPNYLE